MWTWNQSWFYDSDRILLSGAVRWMNSCLLSSCSSTPTLQRQRRQNTAADQCQSFSVDANIRCVAQKMNWIIAVSQESTVWSKDLFFKHYKLLCYKSVCSFKCWLVFKINKLSMLILWVLCFSAPLKNILSISFAHLLVFWTKQDWIIRNIFYHFKEIITSGFTDNNNLVKTVYRYEDLFYVLMGEKSF